jgi:hypothetical protein
MTTTTTTSSDDHDKRNDAVTMIPIIPCAETSASSLSVAAAAAAANNNDNGVNVVAQHQHSSDNNPDAPASAAASTTAQTTPTQTANSGGVSISASAGAGVSWIHPTSYDLYTQHIIPTSKATRVEKRAGVLRYSLNHVWSKVRGGRSSSSCKYNNHNNNNNDALFLEFGVHEGKDMCRIAAFVREKERQESSSQNKRNGKNKASTIVHGFDSFQGLPEAWDNGQRVQVEDNTEGSTKNTQTNTQTNTNTSGIDTNTNTKPAFDKGKFDLGGVVPVMEAVQKQLGTSKFFSSADKSDIDNNDQNGTSCNVQLHAGWFHDTVSDFFDDQQLKLDQQQQSNSDSSPSSTATATTATATVRPFTSRVKVAFVHADADLYSSTVTFLEEICRRHCWVVGSVITFDEYSNYEGWEQGEYRAWMELSEKYGLEWKYLCYHGPRNNQVKCWSHYGYQSVSVVITAVPEHE